MLSNTTLMCNSNFKQNNNNTSGDHNKFTLVASGGSGEVLPVGPPADTLGKEPPLKAPNAWLLIRRVFFALARSGAT